MGNLCGRSTNTQILEPNNSESTSNTQRLQNEEEYRHDHDAPEASNVNDDEVLDEETIESLEKLRKEMESPHFDRSLVISRLHKLINNLQEIKDSNSLLTEQQSLFDNMAKKPINYIVEKWAVIKKTGAPRKMAKLTACVLEKVGQTGFILVGLSFIGSMLNQATEVPATAESCINFLKSIRCLLAILNSNICSHNLDVVPGSLDSVIDEITNGIIVCCSYARAGFPTKFLQVEGVKEDLGGISNSLSKAIQTLNLDVDFRILDVGLRIANDIQSLKRQRTRVISQSDKMKDIDGVGIHDQIAEVERLLQMDDTDVKDFAVILHGPGGMGKSTMATNVINALQPSSLNFSYASVTLDSNRRDFETQVKELQSEIISQLSKQKSKAESIIAGQDELKRIFSSHSCFIFVDNVVDGNQLYNLFPQEFSTDHMLRILVTSRDVDVRKNIPFDEDHIKLYPIHRLSNESSLILLKKSVNMEDGIEKFQGETQKIEQVAKLCHGIPLLLTLVGKDLKFCREEYYYDDTLKKLKEADFSTYRSTTLNEFLLSVFKLLDKDVQTAFLDICVFFVRSIQHKWDRMCHIVGKMAMTKLAERSMIQKDERDRVIIHDVLEAMALKLAKEKRSRFVITIDPEKIDSNSVKLSDILEEDVDSTKIEGLFVHNLQNSSNVHVQLGNLPSLRIFKSSYGINVEFKEKKGQSSSFDNLCYFRIEHARQRDVIELLLKERKSIIPLKVLSLHSCRDVEEFPKNLGMIQQLRELVLFNWNMLKSVPLDIQHLQCLEVIELRLCHNIESLPEELGQLHSLKTLKLNFCYRIGSLPEELGQLHSLKRLSLTACERLKALPSTISNLSCLRYLHMNGCTSLVSLPDDLWKLTSLESLDLIMCNELAGLPSQLGGLVSLKRLNLAYCKKIERLPEQLGKLHALEKLCLHKCQNLQCLPQSISELQSLRELNMAYCDSITCLPEEICKLGSLEELDLKECRNLQLTTSQLEWMATLKDFRR